MLIDASIKETVADAINDPDQWDEEGGCSMGMIFQLCQPRGQDFWKVVMELIGEGRAYVVEPLDLTSLDSLVLPVTWRAGESSISDIVAHFGKPHQQQDQTLVYDIYVEEVEEGYPAPPSPYAERNLAEPGYDPGCDFPYAGIWPPEALQVHFTFDANGVLQGHRFCVGNRVS
jgi:hypothetical protein